MDTTPSKSFHNGILVTVDLTLWDVPQRAPREINEIDYKNPETLKKLDDAFREPYIKLKREYENLTGSIISDDQITSGKANFAIPFQRLIKDGAGGLKNLFQKFCKMEEGVTRDLLEEITKKKIITQRQDLQLNKHLRQLMAAKVGYLEEIVKLRKDIKYYEQKMQKFEGQGDTYQKLLCDPQ